MLLRNNLLEKDFGLRIVQKLKSSGINVYNVEKRRIENRKERKL